MSPSEGVGKNKNAAATPAGPAALPADKLLALAESMAARGGAGPSTYEELLLLLDMLHGQGKHAEALEVGGQAGRRTGFICAPAS